LSIDSYITKPRVLKELAHHDESKVVEAYDDRVWWIGDELVSGSDVFVTTRRVTNLNAPTESYVAPHIHDASQTYLFIADEGGMEVEVTIGSQTRALTAPMSVFVPAGESHSVHVLRGTGTVLAILRNGKYGARAAT
jgi:mannose-6-phosphate isomerase-like protein (cupin superfamily)